MSRRESKSIASPMRPISFNGEMIRAVRAGTKTQTRRVASIDNPTCPFGAVGDILWVRERWSRDPADDSRQEFFYADDQTQIANIRWKPAYVMPRAACRMHLRIDQLRVERLKSISREDAIAEGYSASVESMGESGDPIKWFKKLWDGLCDEQHRWKKNPLVWVISFSIVDAAAAMDESR